MRLCAKTVAASATVSDEPASNDATGKPGRLGAGDDPQARKPAVKFVTHPASGATRGADFSVCGDAGVCDAKEKSG